jgi:sugar phosphate isomerase/epimerase
MRPRSVLGVFAKRRRLEVAVKLPWKVGVVAFMANPSIQKEELQAIEETLKVFTDDPVFDLVEMQPLSENGWIAAMRALERSSLELAVGAQPAVLNQGYNPSSLSEEERRRAAEKLIEIVKAAAARSARAVAFCSGPDPGPENREAAKAALVKTAREVASQAEKLGLLVLLETFDREWDRKQLIGPLRDAVEVAREVRGEFGNFGLLWDLSHAPLLNEKPSDLSAAWECLLHVHIGCAKRLPDGRLADAHPGFYRPGAINGVEEVAELLKVLLDIGYKGAVSFEVKPEEGQGWREPVETAKSVLYTAFAKVVEST